MNNAGANASWPSDVFTFSINKQEAERESVKIDIYNKNDTTDTLIGTCSYVLKPLLDKAGQVSAIELPLQQGGGKPQGNLKLKICCEDKAQRSTVSASAGGGGEIVMLKFEGIQAMDQDDGGLLGSW